MQMFEIYIAKAAENSGLIATREIYQRAIEVLPDQATARMCIRFANMERKLGEIDRARALYAHASQFCDPRVHADFWQAWKDFEAETGSDDTFRKWSHSVARWPGRPLNTAPVDNAPCLGSASADPFAFFAHHFLIIHRGDAPDPSQCTGQVQHGSVVPGGANTRISGRKDHRKRTRCRRGRDGCRRAGERSARARFRCCEARERAATAAGGVYCERGRDPD